VAKAGGEKKGRVTLGRRADKERGDGRKWGDPFRGGMNRLGGATTGLFQLKEKRKGEGRENQAGERNKEQGGPKNKGS